jgi:hypothetical protein
MSGEILQAGVNPVPWRIAGSVIKSSHQEKHVRGPAQALPSYVPQPPQSVAPPRPPAVKGVAPVPLRALDSGRCVAL